MENLLGASQEGKTLDLVNDLGSHASMRHLTLRNMPVEPLISFLWQCKLCGVCSFIICVFVFVVRIELIAD